MRSGILEVVDKEADGLMPTGTRVCSLSRHRGVHHREGDRGFNGGITRRVTSALALALSALLVLAPAALAAAGGGSSGFGGGGGGGGGSSGSGDGGGGGVLLFGLIAVGFIAFLLVGAIGRARYRRERRRRVERVRAAAAEAAEDDAYLAADAVGESAAKLFMSCQEAWDARDRERLAQLVGQDLLVEWRRRLDDFDRKGWHNRVEVIAGPEVEYVGLVNREDDSQDRVVVRIEATLEDYVEDRRGRRITRTDSWDLITTRAEYWTLARRGDAWMVVSIEQQAEDDHHLEDRIVAVPWGDDELLREETLVERAAADKTLDGYKIAELADFELADDARAQALDLCRVAGAVARPGSHRTVLVLFTHGSSGRRVANPAAGRFIDLDLSPLQRQLLVGGGDDLLVRAMVQLHQRDEPAVGEKPGPQCPIDLWDVAQRPQGPAPRVDALPC